MAPESLLSLVERELKPVMEAADSVDISVS